MSFPTWIDPTPLTRAFVEIVTRRSITTRNLWTSDKKLPLPPLVKRTLKQKAEADAALRGETMPERRLRLERERKRRANKRQSLSPEARELMRQAALKAGAIASAKAKDDMEARGETLEERRRRQMRESQQRRRERLRA